VKLQKAYSSDLEEDFPDIMVRFSGHLNQMGENVSTSVKLLRQIRESDIVDAYPNVEIALRLYFTIPVANTDGERSFSLFKRIKSRMRSNITQEKLNDTFILTIESDSTAVLNCKNLLISFACLKARKKTL